MAFTCRLCAYSTSPTGLMPFLPCFYLPPFARLFGPLSWRLSFSWHLLATICAYFADWAGPCPSLALCFDMAVSLLSFLLSVGLSGLLNGMACPPPCLGCLPTYLYFDAGLRGGPAFASSPPFLLCNEPSGCTVFLAYPSPSLDSPPRPSLAHPVPFSDLSPLPHSLQDLGCKYSPPSRTPRAEGL